MREAVAVIYQLLRGERRAFDGKVFRLRADHALQYPVERPDIPLLIGTWGAKLAAFAGRASPTRSRSAARRTRRWSRRCAR